MQRGGTVLGAAAMLALAGCGGQHAKLQVRPTPTSVAAGAKPVPLRIAEARAQFALGNVALALQSFRKAMRDDPGSVDALAGVAACYDRMGRFDLSRRHYESALAIAPGDPQLLAALAASLDQQGRTVEAASVRVEIAQRLAAAREGQGVPAAELAGANGLDGAESASLAAHTAMAPGNAPGPMVSPANGAEAKASESPSQPMATPPAGPSVTVALPPARPAPVPANRVRPVRTPTQATAQADQAAKAGPRLERTSMGEVALITTAGPIWRAQEVRRTQRSATLRFVPVRQASEAIAEVRLLNAARVDRLAARTRAFLAGRGWRGLAIGDAPAVRARSVILYPRDKRRLALKLSAQFGFAIAPRADSREITVLLGRDAAGLRALRSGA